MAANLCVVFSFIAFMKASDANQAGLFGMLSIIKLIWAIRSAKVKLAETGAPLFHLGMITPLGRKSMACSLSSINSAGVSGSNQTARLKFLDEALVDPVLQRSTPFAMGGKPTVFKQSFLIARVE